MNYSLTKIARELGLSKATVSLILSGNAENARISRELEEKVRAYCEKVNYVPNIYAQRINSKYVKNVGLLINRNVLIDSDDPFSDPNVSSLTGGVVASAEKAGYRVTIQLYSQGMSERKAFDWFRNREIDALIYYGAGLPDAWRETFIKEGRKAVGIGTEPGRGVISVGIDNFAHAKKLTELLIERGRKKFAFAAGISQSHTAKRRFEGFLEALTKNGMKFDENSVLRAEFSEKLAEEKALEFFSEKTRGIDALVCANDDMAIGAIRALKKLGIEIPRQIAVTGGDNIPIGQYFSPSITTIDNKSREAGEAAFKTVLKMIKGAAVKDVTLPSGIIIRESI